MHKAFAMIRAADYGGAIEAAGRGMPLAGPAQMFQFAFLRGLARICRDEDPAICARMKAGFMSAIGGEPLSRTAKAHRADGLPGSRGR